MSETYLQLVNKVCTRINETQLTSSNFSGALGIYATIKAAVNDAILSINRQDFEWPFNHQTYNETLVAGTNRYSFPSNLKSADMDSFRIQRDNSLGVVTTKLSIVSYEDYMERMLDDEYNTDTGIRRTPRYVFRTPDGNYGVWPIPDKAYTLTYEYFKLPEILGAWDDETNIPDAYKDVIAEGAMVVVENFREQPEKSSMHQGKFDEMINDMRTIFTNRYDYVRTGYIDQTRQGYSNYWTGY